MHVCAGTELSKAILLNQKRVQAISDAETNLKAIKEGSGNEDASQSAQRITVVFDSDYQTALAKDAEAESTPPLTQTADEAAVLLEKYIEWLQVR